MKSYTALLLAVGAAAAPQGVTENLLPAGSAPAGCVSSYDGQLELTTVNLAVAKRGVSSLEKRAECGAGGKLTITLQDGVLTDGQGRTGYIADNYQFQFDGPPQTGAIITAGFSICQNGSLALGGSTTFYGCVSGEFSNLYDRDWADQCSATSLVVVPCGDTQAAPNAGAGNVVGTTMVQTTLVTVLADGQPQVVPTVVPVPLCQIGDGQVQAQTTFCGEAPAVTQIGDGQIQAPASGQPVTQIGDGQIQAPTGQPVTEIGDGQIQIPTGQPVTQIPDGQIQVPTDTASVPNAQANGTAVPTFVTANANTRAPAVLAGLLVAIAAIMMI